MGLNGPDNYRLCVRIIDPIFEPVRLFCAQKSAMSGFSEPIILVIGYSTFKCRPISNGNHSLICFNQLRKNFTPTAVLLFEGTFHSKRLSYSNFSIPLSDNSTL